MPKRCELWRPMGNGKWRKYFGILDKKGEPKTVQSYKRCTQLDQKKSSQAERAAAARKKAGR